MARVSIDTAFYKSELLRISVHVLRTIELQALEIFKAVVDCGGVTRAAAQLHRGLQTSWHLWQIPSRQSESPDVLIS
jgi:hypothetical protein